MRRPFIAGNWKMNQTLSGTRELIEGIKAGLSADVPVDVAVCPPYVYLTAAVEVASGSPVEVGSQDLYFEASGAFTGEISADMLTDIGATCAIIGHSERRNTIGHLEDDRMINLKIKASMKAGLVPIFCVGEMLAQRKSGATLEVLTYQLRAGLVGVEVTDPANFVVAYEPVWAIGTGEVATPEQAQEAHAHIRRELKSVLGDVAGDIRILYGGSMKPDNAPELLAQPDVDGGLIGGASLKADSFLGIIQAAVAAQA